MVSEQMNRREKSLPPGYVWADSSLLYTVITLGGGMLTLQGERQMAQIQIAVLYIYDELRGEYAV